MIPILSVNEYSVLISVYQNEEADCLAKAIDSMLKQTCPPKEVVLVKDGPLTKELDDVISEYHSRYPELLTIIGLEENRGLGIALNCGLSACRNELVARMDTDDIAAQDRCEKQLAFMSAHPEVAIVGGQIEEFLDTRENVVGKRIVPCENDEIYAYLKRRCPFNHMTVMFRKSSVLEAGGYMDCYRDEDYFLWIRMAVKKNTFANLPDVLVYVKTNEDTFARRGGKRYLDSEVFLQKYMLQNKLISPFRYVVNVTVRVLVQRILPNRLRHWLYVRFARQKNTL